MMPSIHKPNVNMIKNFFFSGFNIGLHDRLARHSLEHDTLGEVAVHPTVTILDLEVRLIAGFPVVRSVDGTVCPHDGRTLVMVFAPLEPDKFCCFALDVLTGHDADRTLLESFITEEQCQGIDNFVIVHTVVALPGLGGYIVS